MVCWTSSTRTSDMNKLIPLFAIVLLASGCNTFCKKQEPIIKTEYVYVNVPVNSVPAPPKVERPVLETERLTAADRKDVGIVGKAIVVANEQLEAYSKVLEGIVNKYKELADKSEVKSTLDLEDKPKP